MYLTAIRISNDKTKQFVTIANQTISITNSCFSRLFSSHSFNFLFHLNILIYSSFFLSSIYRKLFILNHQKSFLMISINISFGMKTQSKIISNDWLEFISLENVVVPHSLINILHANNSNTCNDKLKCMSHSMHIV